MHRLLIMLIGLTLAITALAVRPGTANADGQPGTDDPVVLIAVDLGSASLSGEDAAVAETALRVLAGGVERGTVAIMPYSGEASAPSDYEAGGTALAGAISTLVQRIASRSDTGDSDQFAALASAFNYLSAVGAPAGSDVFLITGRMEDGSAANRERIIGFADLFIAEDWQINAVMLPSAAPEAREFLSSIVDRASGVWDDAGTQAGLESFASRVLGIEGETVIDFAVGASASAVRAVEVAPETTRLSVTLVRGTGAATIDLFDPNGVQLGPTSNAATFVDTPNFVLTTVDNPEPGTWSLRANGDGRPILASVDLDNPLELALISQPPMPAGEEAVLTAVATVDGVPRWLPGAVVTATVRAPDGSSVVYRLMDDGEGADELFGDGVFTTAFRAADAQGFNDVSLVLSWDDFGASLTAADAFQTEVFPTLAVSSAPGRTVLAGEETVVGTIEVSVGPYPYPVDPATLSVDVTGPDGESIPGTLRAIDMLEDGTGWRYEVLATPQESGPQTVTASLSDEYVGRAFTASGAEARTAVTVNVPVVIPTPAPPPAPVAVAPVLAAPVEPDSSLLPIVGGGAAALVLVAVVVLIVIARRQVAPYGYIYDDRQRLVADLSRIHKGGLAGWFKKGKISARDLAGLPLPGALLIFKRGGLELHYDSEGNRTLRVDGKPAGPVIPLRDGSRIGFAGRLFEFATSLRQPPPSRITGPATG